MQIKSLRMAATWFSLLTTVVAALFTGAIYLAFRLVDIIPTEGDIMQWLPLISLATCMIIGIVFAFIWSKDVLRPFSNIIMATKAVAGGDFSVRVNARGSRGEFAQLIKSFNKMAEELGSLEMLRTNFINDFSHEFKTPVVSIRGFAKQLKNMDITQEQRDEYIDIIITESDRLANMAENILLLNRFENLGIITDRSAYLLDEQIRKCVQLFERKWCQKDITLDGDLDEITYYGNEDIMSHIWINLISNAVKFTPVGGTIKMSLHKEGSNTVFRISDNGEGMTEAISSRIFERFYRADSSSKHEGNGLGLPTAKRIAELCGGDISVKSEPGEGSVFTVTLPD